MKEKSDQTTNDEIIALISEYLLQVVSVQHELFVRLLDNRFSIPPGLSEVFEDAANTFLDLADMVIDRQLKDRAAIPHSD